MGILHVHAAATAHELQDIDLVTQALEWLTESEWNVDMTTSYHGPRVAMLSTQIKKNKQIESFVEKLQPHHADILSELDARLDENNVIHLRLNLESAIGQMVKLISSNDSDPVIKIRIKLAVYPGQKVEAIAADIFG
ncbi:MAG: RNA-binding domain-containing protein [Candidatus Thermoplasmatota archaeon]|nr:RNA-binding domain-containing protein [Candidatus Thermoplasmatota archaeon]